MMIPYIGLGACRACGATPRLHHQSGEFWIECKHCMASTSKHTAGNSEDPQQGVINEWQQLLALHPLHDTPQPAYLVLRCPHCNHLPNILDNERDVVHPANREHTVWAFNCLEAEGGCGASMLGGSKEEVIAKWNQRAKFLTEQDLAAAVMELVELLGAHPAETKEIDPRAWQHLMVYMPKDLLEPLRKLYKELGTLKWSVGADEGWGLAVEAIREHIGQMLGVTQEPVSQDPKTQLQVSVILAERDHTGGGC